MSNHFISAGSHHDEKIAMYAIDSLRQLGMKYLERAELANFTFQNDILKPFVVLMRNSQSESLRSLIVDCIVQVRQPINFYRVKLSDFIANFGSHFVIYDSTGGF